MTTSEVMSDYDKFWDDIAEEYAAKPLPDPEATQKKLAVTRSHMHHDDVVLDVGCGTGTIALELAPHAKHVHGLDISRAMIDIARGKAQEGGVDNVTFAAATLDDDLPFEPESFGVICAYNLLHLVPDMERTLAQIHGLLKPGGTFISSTACLGDSFVPYRLIIGMMRWVGRAPRIVTIMGTEDLLAGIEGAGFEQLSRPDVGGSATSKFVVCRKPIAQSAAA